MRRGRGGRLEAAVTGVIDEAAVGDDSSSDDYGTVEHLAAIERMYAEALVHITALAESWQQPAAELDGVEVDGVDAAEPDGADADADGDGAAEQEDLVTEKLPPVTDEPGVPAERRLNLLRRSPWPR